MATFQQWDQQMPEVAYNPATSANLSSYFGRHNKVVKPSSRNSSPRHLARRRTTTAACISSRNRSAVDQLRSTRQPQNSETTSCRPVSWHPDYFDATSFTIKSPGQAEDLSCWNYPTTQAYGLVTPLSYPAINEPQIHEFFTPLDQLQGQESGVPFGSFEHFGQQWQGQAPGKAEAYPQPFYPQIFLQPQYQGNRAMIARNMQTAPSSPDGPPLHGLDTLTIGTNGSSLRDDTKELVGLGLYDSPAEIQSTSLLFGEIPGSTRKSLKLEESFEPSEQDDEDDEDVEEEEDKEEEEVSDNEVREMQYGMRQESDERWSSAIATEYPTLPTAPPLAYNFQQRSEPLAHEYLATLRQMNSTYYPSDYSVYGQGYGWI